MSCLRNCEHRCTVGGVSCEEVCLDYSEGPVKEVVETTINVPPVVKKVKKPEPMTKQEPKISEKTKALFERSQKLYKEKVNRKNTLERAKQHLIDDLTLDVVQKRALGIPTRRVYE